MKVGTGGSQSRNSKDFNEFLLLEWKFLLLKNESGNYKTLIIIVFILLFPLFYFYIEVIQ